MELYIFCVLCVKLRVYLWFIGGVKDWKVWTEVWILWQIYTAFWKHQNSNFEIKTGAPHYCVLGETQLWCAQKEPLLAGNAPFFEWQINLDDVNQFMFCCLQLFKGFSFLLIENDVQWGELKRFQKKVREDMDNFTQLSWDENDHAYRPA